MKTLTEDVNELLISTPDHILTKFHLNKKYPELLDRIDSRTSYLGENCKLTERIYHIINDIYESPICEHPDCNNILKFGSLGNGYRRTCSNKCGVYVNKLVKLEEYGDENYNNMNKMLQTKIENNSYIRMVETHKATCLEKYGVEHHWMVEEIQDKMKNNFIENYGVDNPMKLKEIQDKVKLTNIEKYGCENVFQYQPFIDIIKVKTKNTMLERYGVENYSQTGLNETSGYKWKEYITPNSNILKVQGHEPKLLDELLLEYHEDEILTSRKDMPEIWYLGLDGKQHRYFPDMFITKTNTIYEVKSDYTLNVDLETNNLKFQSVKDAGYNFVLKVY